MTIEAEEIVVWVLVFLRTGAFFLGIPLFAGKLIPVKVRTAFALLLSILINPLIPAQDPSFCFDLPSIFQPVKDCLHCKSQLTVFDSILCQIRLFSF